MREDRALKLEQLCWEAFQVFASVVNVISYRLSNTDALEFL